MISKSDLKKLIDDRLKDADVLLQNKRYRAAIYISGYAVEMALKLKVCYLFRFKNGFPETITEFNNYQKLARSGSRLRTTIRSIRQIRIHDLSQLLKYSGEEINIKNNYATDG